MSKIKVQEAPSKPRSGSLADLIALSGKDRKFFIDMLIQACHDKVPEAIRFMLKWDELNEIEQELIDIDFFAQAAGVNPRALKGLFIEEIARYKQSAAALRAAMSLDEVVETAIDQAKTPKGIEDRKIILRNQKFIEERAQGPLVQIDQSSTLRVEAPQERFEALLRSAHQRTLQEGIVEGEIIAEKEEE